MASIQQALNNMLTQAAVLKTFGGFEQVGQNAKETFNAIENEYFGTDPYTGKPKVSPTQEAYETSGQAEADIAASQEFEAQKAARENKAYNSLTDRNATKQSQKEALKQRKEYLRKPRTLNRHGVRYQEVMKDGG